MQLAIRLLLASSVLLAPAVARGQDPPSPPEERSTGLPSKIDWTFNFDAGWGTFGFGNSLFVNPRDDVRENLSDQWFEGYVKPALSGKYTGAKGEIYGKVSAVGERTYGSAPPVAGEDISSFQFEDANIGWRSGETSGASARTRWTSRLAACRTNSDTGCCSTTVRAKAAAAAATGPTRARPFSSRRSAASSRAEYA